MSNAHYSTNRVFRQTRADEYRRRMDEFEFSACLRALDGMRIETKGKR